MGTGNTETLGAGAGSLNALVIKECGKVGQETVLRAAVHDVGSNPSAAERQLAGMQDEVLDDSIHKAVTVGGIACEVEESRLTSTTQRIGDAAQDVRVQFDCSVAPEECCRLGLATAAATLQYEMSQVQATVAESPLRDFLA